jgi:hypothetical protein
MLKKCINRVRFNREHVDKYYLNIINDPLYNIFTDLICTAENRLQKSRHKSYCKLKDKNYYTKFNINKRQRINTYYRNYYKYRYNNDIEFREKVKKRQREYYDRKKKLKNKGVDKK